MTEINNKRREERDKREKATKEKKERAEELEKGWELIRYLARFIKDHKEDWIEGERKAEERRKRERLEDEKRERLSIAFEKKEKIKKKTIQRSILEVMGKLGKKGREEWAEEEANMEDK